MFVKQNGFGQVLVTSRNSNIIRQVMVTYKSLTSAEGILYITILEPCLLPQIGDQIIEHLWTQILVKNAKNDLNLPQNLCSILAYSKILLDLK